MNFLSKKKQKNTSETPKDNLSITSAAQDPIEVLATESEKLDQQPKPTLAINDLPAASEVLEACSDAGKMDDKDAILGTIVSYFTVALPALFNELLKRAQNTATRVAELITRSKELPDKFDEMQARYTELAEPMLQGMKNDLTEIWRSSINERADRLDKISEMKKEKFEAEGDLASYIVRLTGSPFTEMPDPIKGEWAVPVAIVALTIAIDWILGTDTFAIASNTDTSGIISFVGALILAGTGVATGLYLRQRNGQKSAEQRFESEYGDKGGYSYSAEAVGDKVKKLKESPEDLIIAVSPLDYSVMFNLRLVGWFFIGLIIFITVMRGYIIQTYLDGDWSQFMSTGMLFAATAGGFIAKYFMSPPYSKAALKKWKALKERTASISASFAEAEKEEDAYRTNSKLCLRRYSESLNEIRADITKPVEELRAEKAELIVEIKSLQLERRKGIKQPLEDFVLEVINLWGRLKGEAWLPRPSATRIGNDFDNHSGWPNLDGKESEVDKVIIASPKLKEPDFILATFEMELARQFPLPLAIVPAEKTKLRAVPQIRSLGA